MCAREKGYERDAEREGDRRLEVQTIILNRILTVFTSILNNFLFRIGLKFFLLT